MDDYCEDGAIYASELAYLRSAGGRWPTRQKAVDRCAGRKLGKLISVMAVLRIAAPIIQAHA